MLSAGEAQASALGDVSATPFTYAELLTQVERLAGQLAGAGISSNDRVAIVLENGAAAAIAFLAVVSCATAAPLNDAYREQEFAQYFRDLRVRAVISRPGNGAVDRATPPDALRLSLTSDVAGYGLRHDGVALPEARPLRSREDDVALVLHTSGTTSWPKIVPLTHRNLLTSTGNMVRSLGLSAGDRYLNLMPLFHIHGIVSVLAALAAGGSVTCTPGFHAFRFFGWLEEARPTWFSAVPTMHQLILDRAARRQAVDARDLRFIRSSSAPLPPVVMQWLEQAFRVPVVEAYGMTEAAHLIAANPLPPLVRKPGSVGMPAGGIEVAVMDADGALLPANTLGEVVIRGDNVTAGYDANPEATQAAFCDGWFRTGDQGYRDAEGSIVLTGRLKEIINRGGEKVSPREVEEALLAHPAVSQAVAFAMPDARLGEEVAAAVILADGVEAGEKSLREVAARSLADFKVPRKIVVVDAFPVGPTGKVQRIGLAERLGLGDSGSGKPR